MELSNLKLPIFVLLRLIAIVRLCTGSSVDTLISQGTVALSKGQLNEALGFYSDAVSVDPKNYMALYRRATVYIAMGKLRSALHDIEKTVELNPGFVLAHKQKANIHLKLGNLKEAKASLLILKSDDSALQETLNQIEEMQSSIEKAKKLYADGKYSEVIHLLDFAMATVTSNSELHEMRGNCYLRTGEQIKGIEELRQSVHMVTDNREGMLRVSILMYEAGLVARSLEEVRRCIQLDQDDSNCRQHYKKVKVLADAQTNSESEKWAKCLSLAQKFLEVEDNNAEPILQAKIIICHCGSRTKPESTLDVCEYVIKKMPQSIEPHFDMAEGFISLSKYAEAEAAYHKILEIEPNNQKAKEGVKSVQRLIKNANRRDYYKILGVKRTATDQEIMKAYRAAAGSNHPDLASNPEEKKAAEKKFIELSEAREVLLNKEMRAQFDSGIDPKDPEAQQQRGGPFGHHPFAEGQQFFTDGGPFGFQFHNFNPFGGGGGGGNFEFHFG